MDGADDRHTYAPGALLPGTPYEVERRLGAGGMGVVYVVRHTFLNRVEALKTIHPELVDRRDIAERMHKEAEVIGNLRHPNIVQVTGGGIIEDEWRLPYFAMEMLRGKNLREVLKKKTLGDVASIYSVATDVLGALAEAHANGIVHRDVKPENIFLHLDTTRSAGPKITTKLLDFGVVAVLGGRQSGIFRGTYKYAAPEQLRGEKVSPQTDIYAMGLVVFEMIAGRGPFDDARDVRAIVKAQLEQEAPRLSRFVDAPHAIDELLARVLAKDPAKRPQTAMALAQELFVLKQISESEPILIAARTQEMLLTTVAERTGEQRDALGTPGEKTKPDLAPRTPAAAREEDKTSEELLPFGMMLQGGTLENAEPPSGSKPSGGDPVRLAFEKTDVDRRALTRTADPIPMGAPRHGTEPIPPPRSDPPESARRHVELETFLAEEAGSVEPGHADRSGSSFVWRDASPPVLRLWSVGDTNATPAPSASAKRRIGRGLAVGAIALGVGALAWLGMAARSPTPTAEETRVAAKPVSTAPVPVQPETREAPSVPLSPLTATSVAQMAPPIPSPIVVTSAPTTRSTRTAPPSATALSASSRAASADPPAAAPSGAALPLRAPTPPPAITGDSDLKRTFVH